MYRRHSAVSCAKAVEPIDLPFNWVVDSRGPKKAQVAPMCPDGRAHWRHVTNTIEPSVRSDDAVLCQITLTTC